MIRALFIILSLIFTSGEGLCNCVGRMINPITDVCWSCIFPITIAGMPVSQGEDTSNPRTPICYCKDPPRIGIPISFWEPVRLVDVTRTPYCMVSLGGITMGPANTIQGHGTVGHSIKGHMQQSFYHVHWYIYPMIYWLELLTDFICLEKAEVDVAYLTELDPLWGDDETSFIINPEAGLFGNSIAQAACAADCVAASAGFGVDALFWCAGCQGSMYPFTGSIPAHSGGIQASLLAIQRFMAKLHREGLLMGYIGTQGLCGKYPMPIIRKSQYKTQMTYPAPSNSCHPLGRSDLLWSSGKTHPYQGEDFGYLIWRKRNCCLL
ncbi:MAG: TraU family protein [Alphaproteobacteria bacterium]|jgi:conjugal transfer pilus assembly protein TraU|nr:TraU family protein [Alphaproteobacteria bacterium]MBT5389488.1 TraU family protein [Alphaproteobacteria bacterium]MBT5541087.1 TraU family protein [Alphaproteobacteria bacterium]MBT5653928.1 TraU family protein [Alphaproteobacteria bacterium]